MKLSTFFVLALLVTYTIAQSSSDDGSSSDDDDLSPRRDRPDRDDRPRRVSAELNGNDRIRLESVLRNGAFKNEWETEVRFRDDRLEVRLEYKQEANGTESEISFRVRIDREVRFVENGTTPGFQALEDTNNAITPFPNSPWTTPTVSMPDADGVRTISASTMDGQWTFEGMIGERPFDVEFAGTNFTVFPNTLKFTIRAQNLAYTNGQDRIAFRVKVEYGAEFESDDNDGDDNDGDDDSSSSSLDDSMSASGSSSSDDTPVAERRIEVGSLASSNSIRGLFEFIPRILVDGTTSTLIPTRNNLCVVNDDDSGSASGSASGSESDDSDSDDLDAGACAQLFLTVDAVAPSGFTWDPEVGFSTGVFDPTTGQNVNRAGATTSAAAFSSVAGWMTTLSMALLSSVFVFILA